MTLLEVIESLREGENLAFSLNKTAGEAAVSVLADSGGAKCIRYTLTRGGKVVI